MKGHFQKKYSKPLLTIEQVCSETETPATTIRTWILRKNIQLTSSINHGRGSQALYSMRDFIQFVVFAELSKISRGPQLLEEDQADYIFSIILGRICDIEANKGDYDSDRFIFVCWADGQLVCDSAHTPGLEFERKNWFEKMNSSWILVDCLRLAHKILEVHNKYSD